MDPFNNTSSTSSAQPPSLIKMRPKSVLSGHKGMANDDERMRKRKEAEEKEKERKRTVSIPTVLPPDVHFPSPPLPSPHFPTVDDPGYQSIPCPKATPAGENTTISIHPSTRFSLKEQLILTDVSDA